MPQFITVGKTAQAQGTLFNTYTTAKSVLPVNAVTTLWPDAFRAPGDGLRITGVAGVSNRVTGPDTFTMQVMVGSVIAFTSGAINLTTTAHTTIPMWFEILLTADTVGTGTTAKLRGQALFNGQMVAMAASLADGVANTGWAMGPNTAPAVGSGFDSTIANTLDLWVAQSFSGAGNGIQIWEYLAELIS